MPHKIPRTAAEAKQRCKRQVHPAARLQHDPRSCRHRQPLRCSCGHCRQKQADSQPRMEPACQRKPAQCRQQRCTQQKPRPTPLLQQCQTADPRASKYAHQAGKIPPQRRRWELHLPQHPKPDRRRGHCVDRRQIPGDSLIAALPQQPCRRWQDSRQNQRPNPVCHRPQQAVPGAAAQKRRRQCSSAAGRRHTGRQG